MGCQETRSPYWLRFVPVVVLLLIGAACGGGESVESSDPQNDGQAATEGAGGETDGQSEPIRIGVIQPFSGSAALYAEEIFRGNELAVDEINSNGGLLGRQVELVQGDASNADQGASEARRLVTQENVDILTGTYISGVSQAASQAAPSDVLYWETNAASQILTERNLPNFVRVGPDAIRIADQSTTFASEVLVQHLDSDISELSFVIEHESSGFGSTIGDRQKATLEELGAQATQFSHEFTASDVTDSVSRAQNEDPDVYILTGYVPDVVLFLRTMRTQDWKPKAIVLVGTGDTPDVLDAVGVTGMEGIFVVGYPRLDINPDYGNGAADFKAKYLERYGDDPKAPNGLTSYTGTQVLFEAVEKAGSLDATGIREAALTLEKPVGSYPNGYGVEFNERAENLRAIQTVVQWQSGTPVTVFPGEAARQDDEIKGVPLEAW